MFRCLFLGWACVVGGICFADEPADVATAQKPNGNSVIRGPAGNSEIVITTTDRLAGAIHSLHWNDREFIDSQDHGRQLQSAASFDCALPQKFWAECYNPTEAGSRLDGAGERSTSQLLSLTGTGAELRSTTQMAFWLAPGEKSAGRPALNHTTLSEHLLSKRVHIGYKQLANVIEYEVTFSVPAEERHALAQFEGVTGYMPSEFSRFWKFIPETGEIEELDDGPGEQRYPVLLSTETGTHAMGIFSPDQPSRGYESAGYGRFRFPAEQVVKWNCVFRVRSTTEIAPGPYRFRQFVVVGTQADVQQSLRELVAEFAKPE